MHSDRIDQDRVVLITDEIFVISHHRDLYFYFIDKNDIAHPKLLEKYTIKENDHDLSYDEHGIVCTKIAKTRQSHDHDTDHDDNTGNKSVSNCGSICTSLKFELIIFGGCETVFGESFMKILVDLKLSYDHDNCSIDNNYKNDCNGKFNMKNIKPIIKIKEEKMLIKSEMIVNDENNSKDTYACKIRLDKRFRLFGYECLWNGKHEPVIVIIGGTYNRSVIVFNVTTNVIQFKSKVCMYVSF